MTVKLNKTNSNFQTLYFVIGNCHTPDAAYIALLNQRQDRIMALNTVRPSKLKTQAALIRANRKLQSQDEAERLEGEAEIVEIESGKEIAQQMVKAAEEELAFIDDCINRLQPYRKYSHMSDNDAAEACQVEEWLLELQRRAENYLLTQGTIPHDHFNTMRQHPLFTSHILPGIEELHQALGNNTAVELISNRKQFYDLPMMLGLPAPEALAKQIPGDHPAQ